MATVTITSDWVKFSEKQTLFYADTLENFKNDCVTLEILIPPLCSVVVFSDEGYLNFSTDNGNQQALSAELEKFCKLCFWRKDDFIREKLIRDTPPELSLADLKNEARQIVRILCLDERSRISGTSDTNKTASWAIYRDLANRFKSNLLTNVEKTCLEMEISLRQVEGETLVSFVDKILQNSELFLKATTIITGAEKRANLDIDQAQNKENLSAAIQKLKDTLKVLE